MSVGPYQDITFDRDGDVDAADRTRLLGLDCTDLVMFAHGWNNSPREAARLFSAFFAPFPGLLGPGVRMGYAGIVWPSMRFTDEPVPAPSRAAAGRWPVAAGSVPVRGGARIPPPGERIALDVATRMALQGLFPGHEATVARLAALLELRPDRADAFAEFGRLARQLAEAPPGGLGNCFGQDLPQEEMGPPALLYEDVLTLCREFSAALETARPGGFPGAVPGPGTGGGPGGLPQPGGLPGGPAGGGAPVSPPASPRGFRDGRADGPDRLWRGAKELLRQTTYYALKRRAGAVGELGLGPLLGQLARSRPGLRVHLVGHSQGARLVAFALRGLPDGARNVKSVTLLQGAFSHYAFAPSLPHAAQRSGALGALEQRVDGPVVACYSRHDSALGVLYPLASRLARDERYGSAQDRRWWAVGHDGLRAVVPSVRLTLEEALGRGVPGSGCVSVDTASVVRCGGPPAGAHNDICHRELARVVVAAGRVGR
ncbi:serine-threonine protein kinase [Streptomyces yaizuensis]|uniref:Serine-threonine protein kinase n=1 Tax=Streptomyces yaizuensis TaxID=2989713 RepID=A0ABQ5P0R4_9ACTN|nr:serine-threonine protein kinase [Streptomyces sp. YSPA8]GLF96193.1 serine-threonine protein kinase [Streptomyces sp. YSPA8]